MAIYILNAIILYTCLIMNFILRNTFESRYKTGYNLAIRAMYMW